MSTKIYQIIIPFFLLIFFIPAHVFGAEFLLSSSVSSITLQSEFTVNLSVNTENADANAFGGEIIFPQNLLTLKEIRDGNSIVNFWVSPPIAGTSSIPFSGITPGGYQGTGTIISLVFEAKQAGKGIVSITNPQILNNDGSGSALPSTASNFSFSIGTSSAAVQTVSPILDQNPPENFVPDIARNPNIFNDAWFVAFATSDKGSGVKAYQIKETPYPLFAFLSPWKFATSPYQLADQNLHSYVFVSAIDNAGNIRIETLAPKNPLPFYENLEYWFILIVAGLVVYGFFLWKKHKIK